MKMILPLALCAALPCAAQDDPSMSLICAGSNPGWTLNMSPDSVTFSYLYNVDLEIALETRPQNDIWPRAYTLMGRGSSAILLVEPNMCAGGILTARVLTQRADEPILLTGCCTRTNR